MPVSNCNKTPPHRDKSNVSAAPSSTTKQGRGGRRPGAGRKPAPPKIAPFVALELKGTLGATALAYRAEALGTLLGAMRDPAATAASRIAAAKHILDAAKLAEADASGKDDREYSDLDLARWILHILENAADEADKLAGKEAGLLGG
jgi:hypothetical protein